MGRSAGRFPRNLDALFHGLDRIEEARGIYRLMKLNMVGLMLEGMGQKLDEDPTRLVQTYLLDCLSSGEGHEFARPLQHMITDAGMKEPQTESALVDLTGSERWQVISALTELAREKIVRDFPGGLGSLQSSSHEAFCTEPSGGWSGGSCHHCSGVPNPLSLRFPSPFWIAFTGLDAA